MVQHLQSIHKKDVGLNEKLLCQCFLNLGKETCTIDITIASLVACWTVKHFVATELIMQITARPTCHTYSLTM